MTVVASALFRFPMMRVRLAQSSRRVGFRRSLSGIGAARMSRSAASMSGASVCRAVMDVRSRAWRMAWFAALVRPCRSAFRRSHWARVASHRREMSFLTQIVPVQYRRSSLNAALLVSKKSSCRMAQFVTSRP